MLDHHSTDDGADLDRQLDDLEAAPHRELSCPECNGDLADGQGLLGCVECGWYGRLA